MATGVFCSHLWNTHSMQGTCQTLGVLFNHQLLREVAAALLQMKEAGPGEVCGRTGFRDLRFVLNHTSYRGFVFCQCLHILSEPACII